MPCEYLPLYIFTSSLVTMHQRHKALVLVDCNDAQISESINPFIPTKSSIPTWSTKSTSWSICLHLQLVLYFPVTYRNSRSINMRRARSHALRNSHTILNIRPINRVSKSILTRIDKINHRLNPIVNPRYRNNWSKRLMDKEIAVQGTFINEMGLDDCVLAFEITKDEFAAGVDGAFENFDDSLGGGFSEETGEFVAGRFVPCSEFFHSLGKFSN